MIFKEDPDMPHGLQIYIGKHKTVANEWFC